MRRLASSSQVWMRTGEELSTIEWMPRSSRRAMSMASMPPQLLPKTWQSPMPSASFTT